jgi:hypothetical protein
LAYTGVLVWDEAPPEAGANVSVIPYLLGGVSKDFESEGETQYRREFGMDAKIALTSSLNLDLTVNPDFSRVEVDRQVTNLDRFELFFPERRQFFWKTETSSPTSATAPFGPFSPEELVSMRQSNLEPDSVERSTRTGV